MRNFCVPSIGLVLCIGLLVSCSDKQDVSSNESNASEKADSLMFEEEVGELIPTPTEKPSHPLLQYAPSGEPSEEDKKKMRIPGADGYLTALPVPGHEGCAFNPYTFKIVDLQGIPSGTKVRDPMDPNPDHVFRAP